MDDERHGLLVEAIKKLRQRAGVKAPRSDFPIDLFGAKDWDDMVQVIEFCVQRVNPEMDDYALIYALNLWDLGLPDSVIERRKYYAQAFDVSVSTAERREEVAAQKLATNIERMAIAPSIESLIGDAVVALMRLKWVANRAGLEVDTGLLERTLDTPKVLETVRQKARTE